MTVTRASSPYAALREGLVGMKGDRILDADVWGRNLERDPPTTGPLGGSLRSEAVAVALMRAPEVSALDRVFVFLLTALAILQPWQAAQGPNVAFTDPKQVLYAFTDLRAGEIPGQLHLVGTGVLRARSDPSLRGYTAMHFCSGPHAQR